MTINLVFWLYNRMYIYLRSGVGKYGMHFCIDGNLLKCLGNSPSSVIICKSRVVCAGTCEASAGAHAPRTHCDRPRARFSRDDTPTRTWEAPSGLHNSHAMRIILWIQLIIFSQFRFSDIIDHLSISFLWYDQGLSFTVTSEPSSLSGRMGHV